MEYEIWNTEYGNGNGQVASGGADAVPEAQKEKVKYEGLSGGGRLYLKWREDMKHASVPSRRRLALARSARQHRWNRARSWTRGSAGLQEGGTAVWLRRYVRTEREC